MIDKIVQGLVSSHANLCLKHLPHENMKTKDVVDYMSSISISYVANMLLQTNEFVGYKMDMKKTLNGIHEALKFHLLEKN